MRIEDALFIGGFTALILVVVLIVGLAVMGLTQNNISPHGYILPKDVQMFYLEDGTPCVTYDEDAITCGWGVAPHMSDAFCDD